MKRSIRFLIYAIILILIGLLILFYANEKADIWGIISLIAAVIYLLMGLNERKKGR